MKMYIFLHYANLNKNMTSSDAFIEVIEVTHGGKTGQSNIWSESRFRSPTKPNHKPYSGCSVTFFFY